MSDTEIELDVDIVKHLTGLYERLGELTAESVVAAASSPASPLHALFEWDDSIAAREYRKVQARALIRRVTVLIDDRTLRAFPFIKSERSFAPIRVAMENVNWMEEIVVEFERAARSFESRWKNHKYVADHYARWLSSQKAT